MAEQTWTRGWFDDKIFFNTLAKVGIPIAIQYLITNLALYLDLLMVGQLNDTAVAAMGLANQVFFLLELMIFGVSSGSAIFSAHHWGSRDLEGVHRALGGCLTLCVFSGLAFSTAALVFPHQVMAFYTGDVSVIDQGVQYLRIIGLSYLPLAVTTSFGLSLRSTENSRLPMLVNAFAWGLNILLNYGLIFGHFGLPAMGLEGAATGSTIARLLECLVLVFCAYRLNTPSAAPIRELFAFDRAFLSHYLKLCAPVVLNEIAWSWGVTLYRVAYAGISTEAIAAVNICYTLEELAFVPFLGISMAGAVMIGNRIGAGEKDKALIYARRLIVLQMAGAALMGLLIIFNRELILSPYQVGATTHAYASQILLIFGSGMWIRLNNMLFVIGLLRAGGDTQFTFRVEILTIWLVGVPLAFLGARFLHLPVYWVYGLVLMEEAVKAVIVWVRFLSGRWVHDLVRVKI